MTTMSQAEVVERATAAAELHGYTAETQPGRNSGRRIFWQRKRSSDWIPDLLVKHGDKSAVIEAKITPPLLGAVSQTREYGDRFGAQPIICVPDASFERIPESVREYAGRVNVRLYPVSQIEGALKDLLQ